ncbi:MAG: VWA domain-containing protein [Planctomycetota bacterium]
MNFRQPEFLYFILPLTILVFVLGLRARSLRRRAVASFVDAAMAPRIVPHESSSRFWAKLILWELGLVFSLAALARPQWGDVVEEVKVKGSDLYVMIDVSRSMLCKDVPPNRLERAKADVSSLLNSLKGERVGLIAFAGRAVVKCPLTSDYPFFRATLSELNPNSVDKGGTAIGDAIRTALHVLPTAPDRDQALLLITDGDDQDSDPLHAAAEAAERHVTIFTVGLGDPSNGSAVPDKDGVGKIAQYEGKDVMSKMGGETLEKIAMQAKGKYVPAGTRAYDLGKLYEENLSQLRGEYAKEQKLRRMAERFEIPLLLALLCFTLELLIRPYRQRQEQTQEGDAPMVRITPSNTPATAATLVLLSLLSFNAFATTDARELAKEGMSLYAKKEYEAAAEKFKAAEKAVQPDEQEVAARAAFAAGCSFQKKGDAEKAKESYMSAATARDKTIAAAAQFNLGMLEADAAKTLAGTEPEKIEPDKRPDVVKKLLEAVQRYRTCLDVKPDYSEARKNIEVIRQWLKLYSNKWAELDRKKRRDELDLVQFLDFLVQTQRSLRFASRAAGEYSSPDDCFELKRVQDILNEEIEPLKEKVDKAAAENPQPQQPGQATAIPDLEKEKQKAEAVKKIKEWANEAGEKMRAASAKLNDNKAPDASIIQKEAESILDRMWEAVTPFGVELGRCLKEETQIVNTLKPPEKEEPADKKDDSTKSVEKTVEPKNSVDKPAPSLLKTDDAKTKEETADLLDLQTDVLRRTGQLKIKAEMELKEVEKNNPPPAAPNAPGTPTTPPTEKKDDKKWLTMEDMKLEEMKKKQEEARKKREEEAKKNPQPADPQKKDDAEKEKEGPPSPEEIKKGLQKAIELVPKALDKMNAAISHLKKADRASAYPEAEEAKKILQEIVDAQPKQKNKDQKQDDKKDQQKKDDDKKKEDEKKKDDNKKYQDQKKDGDKKDKQDKDDEKKDGKDPKKQPMSKEQAEAMLRKVRERELDHRKKKQDDLNAIMGKMPGVEKDW